MRVRMRSTTKLTKIWFLMPLVCLVALLYTAYFHQFFNVAHRQKTLVIYNNEHSCSSNARPTQNNIVIVVLSSRKNFARRNLIRQTWGSISNANNVRILAVVFMFGGSDGPDEEITDIDRLEAERAQFGDVIMGDFVDTYRNETLKTIMAYDWLLSFCQETDIVVKTNDDVMLNVFALTEELSQWTPTVLRSLKIWCAVHLSDGIDRNEGSRYYTSPEEYSGDIFPKHCAGLGCITTMRVINMIADEISRSFLGLVCAQEDVFMTGIVLEKVNAAQNENIELINKWADWMSYDLVTQDGDRYEYLRKLFQSSHDQTVDLNEFQERFGTYVFYLISEGPEFEYNFQQLWYLVKKKFRNEKVSIKIDII